MSRRHTLLPTPTADADSHHINSQASSSKPYGTVVRERPAHTNTSGISHTYKSLSSNPTPHQQSNDGGTVSNNRAEASTSLNKRFTDIPSTMSTGALLASIKQRFPENNTHEEMTTGASLNQRFSDSNRTSAKSIGASDRPGQASLNQRFSHDDRKSERQEDRKIKTGVHKSQTLLHELRKLRQNYEKSVAQIDFSERKQVKLETETKSKPLYSSDLDSKPNPALYSGNVDSKSDLTGAHSAGGGGIPQYYTSESRRDEPASLLPPRKSDRDSTPLTGSARHNNPPTQSILNLPISPREIARAKILDDFRKPKPEPSTRYLSEDDYPPHKSEPYVGGLPPRHLPLTRPENARLPPPLSVKRSYDDAYYQSVPDSLALPPPKVPRSKPAALPPNHSNESYEQPGPPPHQRLPVHQRIGPPPQQDHHSHQRPHLNLHQAPPPHHAPPHQWGPPSQQNPTTRTQPQKKTWSKATEEKAPVTDELLPYKDISRCELCNVEFNHPIGAKAHLVGKPHLKKLKAMGLPVPELCVDKSKPNWEERLAAANAPSGTVTKTNTEAPSDEPWPEWMEEKFKDDFCGICNLPLSSITVADDHYLGKKHYKKCNTVYRQSLKPGPDGSETSVQPGDQFYCDICHIHTSSKEIMDQHLSGVRHQNAKHWYRASTDQPLVSETRVREVDIVILDPQKEAEKEADDFLSMAAKMNGL